MLSSSLHTWIRVESTISNVLSEYLVTRYASVMEKCLSKNQDLRILSNLTRDTFQRAIRNKHTFRNTSSETNSQFLKTHTGSWEIIETTLPTQEHASKIVSTKMYLHISSREKILLERYFSTLDISIFLEMGDYSIVEKFRGPTLLDSLLTQEKLHILSLKINIFT